MPLTEERGDWWFEAPLDLQDYLKYHEAMRKYLIPTHDQDNFPFHNHYGEGMCSISSVCPFCQTEYFANVDRYSLLLWQRKGLDFFDKWVGSHNNLLSGTKKDGFLFNKCPHYHGIVSVLNLRGKFPNLKANGIYGSRIADYNMFTNGPELPFFNPLYCTDIPIQQKAAVIQSLPFYQIQGDQFVEEYTLHLITYFVNDTRPPGPPPTAKEMAEGIGVRWSQVFGKPYLWEWGAVLPHILRMFDLEYWMEKGNLYWLDSADPQNLQLRRDYQAWPQSREPGRIFPLRVFYLPSGDVVYPHVGWLKDYQKFWPYEMPKDCNLKLPPPYRFDEKTIHAMAQAGGADPKFSNRLCDRYPLFASDLVDFENTQDWYTKNPDRDSYRQKEHIPFKRGFFP